MFFFGGFFWDWLNVHTFNCRHRADRRVKGWLRMGGRRNGWFKGKTKGFIKTKSLGWMGGFKEWVDGWAEREGKGGVKGLSSRAEVRYGWIGG